MTRSELLEILERHRKWLEGEDGGERADLRKADLYGANLSGAYLYGANLSEADLRYANLSKANLSGADLSHANLSGADLCYANLRHVNLSGAYLYEADLRKANLRYADLSGANLSGANLSGADLYYCCLPLWCGGLRIILDRRQMAQLIFHFCSMECEDSEVLALQKSLYAFANEFVESRADLRNKKFPEVAVKGEVNENE